MEPRRRKKKKRLPDEIIAIPNPDKEFHERWYEGRNALNIPHPFRGVLMGQPNSGKTTIIKNILLRAKPSFEEVVVIHPDAEYTKEYDDLGASVELISEIPTPEDWEGLVKTLVILDDLEFKGSSKEQKRNLDRLYGYVSTHKNISCLLTSQDPFNIPPIVRRCSNLWILWRGQDLDAQAVVARKTGLTADALRTIFARDFTYENEYGEPFTINTDSLWIDTTSKTPFRLRKNGYEVLKEPKSQP